MRESQFLKELKKAFRKLEESSGRRIARNNARKGLRRLLNTIKKDCMGHYPIINKDGTEAKQSVPRGVCCPGCNAPMKNTVMLCQHWQRKHDKRGWDSKTNMFRVQSHSHECPCGKQFHTLREFVAHVSKLKDIPAHFTLGVIGQVGQGK